MHVHAGLRSCRGTGAQACTFIWGPAAHARSTHRRHVPFSLNTHAYLPALPLASFSRCLGPQIWLNQPVPLPGGYRTSRRELLKLASLGGAGGCFYVAATRAKAMSFASPQALLNALMPPPVSGGRRRGRLGRAGVAGNLL